MYSLPSLLVLLSATTLTLAARVTSPNKVPKNAVLLSKVNTLTLRAGKPTSARRVSSVPQLKCVSPAEVCKLYTVDIMRCKNEGSDYDAENIQWSCKASLPEEFKLGSTEVGCEGYESSEDPYVLKGSCGVEYRLLLTDKGEEVFGRKASKGFFGGGGDDASNGAESYAGYLFMMLFCAVAFIILRSLYQAWREDGRRPRGGNNWGGGGGGGGDNDPPPPYDYQPPPKKSYTAPRSYTPRSTTTTPRAYNAGNQTQAEGGWRPGFWTGAAAGAAGAYFAGRNRPATQPQQTTQTRTGPGWFGGGGSGYGTAPPRPAGSSSGSGSSSTSPSYSSSRQESTGFGGTSRR